MVRQVYSRITSGGNLPPLPTPNVPFPNAHLRLVIETFTSSRDSFCWSKTSFFSYSAANRSAASSRRVSSFTFTAMKRHGAVERCGGGGSEVAI